MAYSKTVRRHRKRGKKGGVETRGQKRRVEEGQPAVKTTMRDVPTKKATTKKAPKDPETLAESKPKTKKPTTKKERREAREKLPSVIKQKQDARILAIKALEAQAGPQGKKQIESSAGRSQLSPQDQEALNWANANPNDPRSAQIKQRLGR